MAKINSGRQRAVQVTLDYYSGDMPIKQKKYSVTDFEQISLSEIAQMSESAYRELMFRFKTFVESQEPGAVIDLSEIIRENNDACPIGQV